MSQLTDYSGDFKPDLKPGNFTPEAMEGLLLVYSRLYRGIDGYWYLAVKERAGNDMAFACDLEVCEKQCRNEIQKLTRQLNITGNTLEAMLKTLQVGPWSWNVTADFELKSAKHAIMTVSKCATLEALEREDKGREKDICNTVEMLINKTYAHYFNPDIEVIPVQVPPRKDKTGICCQWEFVIPEKKATK